MEYYTELLDLIGTIFTNVYNQDDKLIFENSDGKLIFEHSQSCCERVYVEDIWGDLEDLVDTPILEASERTKDDPNAEECGQWTFYEYRTIKGSVTVRWYGSSNGYYGVGVGQHFEPSREYRLREKEKNPEAFEYTRYRQGANLS